MEHTGRQLRVRPDGLRFRAGFTKLLPRTWCVLAALIFLPALAWGFSMELPVKCAGAGLCMVQNHFDHDASTGYADYTCGSRTYDALTGTDIRVFHADMRKGVPVLAVADGVVRFVRNGELEGEISLRGKETVKGREEGNTVVVVHADGFETQYSHLKWGSVIVRPEQQVRAGQVLGLLGMSGATDFPHLSLMVRHQGKPVDPFIGPDFEGCGGRRAPLWSAEALSSPVLTYRKSGLLEAGFFSSPPRAIVSILRRLDGIESKASDPPMLVFGVAVFGPLPDDVWSMRLLDPSGQVLVESNAIQKRHETQTMCYVGMTCGAGWRPGRYRGEFNLSRPGEGDVVAVVREVEIP
jgi:hypothetical protein